MPVLLAINELENRKINSVCVTLCVYQQHAQHTQLLGSCRRGGGCAPRAPKRRSQPHTWASSHLGWHQWPLLNNRKAWAGRPQDHVGDTSRAKGLAEPAPSLPTQCRAMPPNLAFGNCCPITDASGRCLLPSVDRPPMSGTVGACARLELMCTRDLRGPRGEPSEGTLPNGNHQ